MAASDSLGEVSFSMNTDSFREKPLFSVEIIFIDICLRLI
jgi:hypothetical protein